MTNPKSRTESLIDFSEKFAADLEDEKGIEEGNEKCLEGEDMSQHNKNCKADDKMQIGDYRLRMKEK